MMEVYMRRATCWLHGWLSKFPYLWKSLLFLFLFQAIAKVGAAEAPVRLSRAGIDENKRFYFQWEALTGLVYKVQSRDSFSPGTKWETEEPVLARQTGPIRWTAPEVIRESRFYRIEMPEP